MFRSATDHHQGVHAFLVKVTELKSEYSCVVMRQHNIQCIYVMFGVVRCADCSAPGGLTSLSVNEARFSLLYS
jgi:hypothetical protein